MLVLHESFLHPVMVCFLLMLYFGYIQELLCIEIQILSYKFSVLSQIK